MSTERGVFVRIGGGVVTLTVNQSIAVNEDEDTPPEALAPITCDTCGALNLIGGPVTFKIHDDEYTSHFDLWFESRHVGECAVCRTAIDVVLNYLRTGKSYRELREFSLSSNVWSKGGKLASTEGVDIPEGALRSPAADLSNGDSEG